MRIIAGTYGGRSIKTGEGPGYRPATGKVRGAMFSMLEARGLVWDGLRVLDVFAGSGSLGIEALSRGAELAWFLEKDAKAAALIADNLKVLGVPAGRFRVLRKDALAVLSRPPERPFGLAFVDPPYGQGLLAPALDNLVQKQWMEEGGLVLAEAEAGLPPLRPHGLELLTDRLYGQTRITLWSTRR
ncbi:16S rRNA (guanine(966)-N(2))-methyltransferase RsmD [Desulfovibrio aminophilus]|nr:16S rRNA (guanine(966)-N(2))-methyltransferase RsmD [Desulfovibrio aminophilus]MCM0755846.1 16S rRNA (guanine(966)-N(2))-methyltransferase RsmD [Desulfovibrio aminophilus]